MSGLLRCRLPEAAAAAAAAAAVLRASSRRPAKFTYCFKSKQGYFSSPTVFTGIAGMHGLAGSPVEFSCVPF
jgi:hypothetical protein